MKSAIRNESLCTIIEVDAAVPLLRVNGSTTYDCWDMREAELFYNIIECHPRVLTYEQIIERILKKYGIADDLYSDPIHYIRKKKLSLCKILSETTGFQQEEIIINVRKVGYRLKTGWERVDVSSDISQEELPESPKNSNHALSQLDLILAEISGLRTIIEETIALSNRLELSEIYNDQENVTLVLNHKGHEQTISELAEKFTNDSRSLLNLLGINPFDNRHIRILRILETIFSYVTMSRQGSNISEETWRILFDRELRSHYECLIAECIAPHL